MAPMSMDATWKENAKMTMCLEIEEVVNIGVTICLMADISVYVIEVT